MKARKRSDRLRERRGKGENRSIQRFSDVFRPIHTYSDVSSTYSGVLRTYPEAEQASRPLTHSAPQACKLAFVWLEGLGGFLVLLGDRYLSRPFFKWPVVDLSKR